MIVMIFVVYKCSAIPPGQVSYNFLNYNYSLQMLDTYQYLLVYCMLEKAGLIIFWLSYCIIIDGCTFLADLLLALVSLPKYIITSRFFVFASTF